MGEPAALSGRAWPSQFLACLSRMAVLVVGAALAGACGGGGSGGGASGGEVIVEVPQVPSARRPTRRIYLARAPERCEIYAENGEDRTEALATPCPEYMQVGERIRVAGRTCMLENRSQPEREKPVVCPDPLTHFEKRERGEEK
jgi:hypothetical protein